MPEQPPSHLTLERRLENHVRLAAAAALGLVLLLPFLCGVQGFRLTYSWPYPKLFALETAAVIAWAGLLIVRPARLDELLHTPGVTLPMAAVLAWGFLSVIWSSAPWAATQPLIELTYMALAVIGFANLLTTTRIRRAFVAAYGVSAGLACAVYAVGYPLSAYHMRVYPFGNPNIAGAFGIMPLAVGAAYAFSAVFGRVGRRAGILGGLVALAAGAAIVVSRSAGALGAGAASVVMVAVFTLRGRLRRSALEVISVVAAVALLWPLLAPGLWGRDWLESQLGARPAMWQGGAALAREHPIRGHGLGTFVVQYARVHPRAYAAHRYHSDIVENAHCFPLHVVVELGVVGLALAAWLLLRAVRTAHAAGRRASHPDRALLRGLTWGGLGMLAQGLVSTSMHQAGSTVHLVLALALIGGTARVWWRRQTPWARKRPLLLRLLPVAALVLLFLFTAGKCLVSQMDLHRAYTLAPEQLSRRKAALEDTIAMAWPAARPGRGGVGRWLFPRIGWPTRWTLRARFILAQVLMSPAVPYVSEALDQMETVDYLAPNFGRARLNKAFYSLKLGRLDAAGAAIASYCQKNPFHEKAYDVWTLILAKAVEQDQPEVARPGEALELLSVVIEHDLPWFRPHVAADLKRPFLKALRRPPKPDRTVAPDAPSG